MQKLTVLHEVKKYDLIRDYLLEAVETHSENAAFVLKEEKRGKAQGA